MRAPAEATPPVGCIAAALRPRHQLAIQLNGSGSCPMVPVGLSVLGPSHVRVSTSDDYGDSICTADFGPAVSVIALPTSVDTTGPITVDVDLLPGPGDAWTTEHRVTVVAAPAG